MAKKFGIFGLSFFGFKKNNYGFRLENFFKIIDELANELADKQLHRFATLMLQALSQKVEMQEKITNRLTIGVAGLICIKDVFSLSQCENSLVF